MSVQQKSTSKNKVLIVKYFRFTDCTSFMHERTLQTFCNCTCVLSLPLFLLVSRMLQVMIRVRSVLLCRSTSHVLSFTRGSHLPTGRTPHVEQAPGHTAIQQSLYASLTPKITALVRYSDLSSQKYTMIYTLPHIQLLRALSRLKLLQTAITVVILPPVYVLYLQGYVSSFLVSYTIGTALFAGAMLYTVSHFIRRVVGMMYLDPSQTTLKVSHLTFWGQRNNIYLPVSDVMTIGDTGDSAKETILKLKRYSNSQTMYFSTYYGRVVDHLGFEKVFGNLK